MDEEDIRVHFLVQLNGQYEGQATGETFNLEGKTDMLIRVENQNIFVAECKFWKGKAEFLKAIEQLFGYLNWRYTKAAIVLFNRGKDTSKVVKQIPEILREHPSFIEEVAYNDESGSRYRLRHQEDTEKEVLLRILVFQTRI